MKTRYYLLLLLILIIGLSPTHAEAQGFKQTGIASFYADKFVGRTTANGEKYKHSKMTAAHKTLPFGTMLKVVNLENGNEVTVRVNDRGPFVEGRIIDLSKSAAKQLDFIQKGLVKVEIVALSSSDESRKPYSSLDKPKNSALMKAKEYYSINVNKEIPNGYGVQIGSFKEMVNLVELADNLRRSYHDRTYVQVSVIQEIKYYKLIIGNLKKREKADKLKMRVSQSYPDSFVIKF